MTHTLSNNDSEWPQHQHNSYVYVTRLFHHNLIAKIINLKFLLLFMLSDSMQLTDKRYDQALNEKG